MSVSEFIRDSIIRDRLNRATILVVYDADRRYAELCRQMADDGVTLVDASEQGIESREVAVRALKELGGASGGKGALLIYVPTKAPVSDVERQVDPFAMLTACGDIFPDPQRAGDEFESLCLRAKPDHATEIRKVFADDQNPSFVVIDNIGGGIGWPTLRAILKVDSARDILFALLFPSETQKEALAKSETWVGEARELYKATLGLKLKTKGKTWSSHSDELWRFLLFSEFAFDLPRELPPALVDVAHAATAARPVVEELCDRLRRDQMAQVSYIERAEAIETEFNLPALCAKFDDLGLRDTFPFEERTFLARAVAALIAEELDDGRAIIDRHSGSVWVGKGESQAQWDLVRAALRLCEACEDRERQLADYGRSQDALIDYYLTSLREVDRLQREFEQSVNDCMDTNHHQFDDVIGRARGRYRRLFEKVQVLFTKHLETAGWPPSGRLANADVFDQIVAPALKASGRRIAYILVDALRYELGVALHQQIAEEEATDLHPAFAQLPSVTPIGMASLLPGAGSDLRLAKKDDGFVPMLGDTVVGNVSQRMDILRKRYGDRFAELQLNDFVRSNRAPAESISLLVLRSVDIDSHLESNADTALSLIHDTLKRLRVAISKLRKFDFHQIVIATDHGFFLNAQAEAGDVCAKPQGTWVNVHDRSLLGEGREDAHNFVMPAEKLGIRGDFSRLAGPRTMAPYRKGVLYFHGGASLQEAVVPVLTINLGVRQAAATQASVQMTYRNGAKRITTRLPVVGVLLETSDMFSLGQDFEILLEAHDKKGNVVGEAKSGGPVNPATGTVTLKPRERIQVVLRMQEEFEGKFTVKALNPSTLATYCSVDLETDYTV